MTEGIGERLRVKTGRHPHLYKAQLRDCVREDAKATWKGISISRRESKDEPTTQGGLEKAAWMKYHLQNFLKDERT